MNHEQWQTLIRKLFPSTPRRPACEFVSFRHGKLTLKTRFLSGHRYCCAEPGCHWHHLLTQLQEETPLVLEEVEIQIICEQGSLQDCLGGIPSERLEEYSGLARWTEGRWRWE